ncbi:MAG: hypothetical protein IIC12_07965 [Proteobacteria bacterium]|nr:hypothetical protein [Pseudomonadota bacterium]
MLPLKGGVSAYGIFTENNIAQTATALMSSCRLPTLPLPASMAAFGG